VLVQDPGRSYIHHQWSIFGDPPTSYKMRTKTRGSKGNRGYKASRRAKLNDMHESNHSKESLPQATPGYPGSTHAKNSRQHKAELSTTKASDADMEFEYAQLSWTVFGATESREESRPEEKPGAQETILHMPRAYATDAITMVNATLLMLQVAGPNKPDVFIIAMVAVFTAVVIMVSITAYQLGRSASTLKHVDSTTCDYAYMTKTTESVFAHQALQAPEDNVDQAVWVDSGCTRTVIRNKRKLINVCKPERLITFQGQGGEIKLTHIRDLPLVLQDGDGNLHKLLIKGCLHAAEALANLLATSDLQKARVGFVVPAIKGLAKLCLDTDSSTVEV
jgi:hypothetical protein